MPRTKAAKEDKMAIIKKISTGIQIYRRGGIVAFVRRLLRLDSKLQHDLWPEYLRYLVYANAGMLERGNVWCMDYAIKNLPSDAPILEIGSFCGLSANVITYLKAKNRVSNPLITCDNWRFPNEMGKKFGGASEELFITRAEYAQFVKDTFIRNVQMFSRNDLPYAIELSSDEFFIAWGTFQKRQDILGREIKLGGPISFCYIDGDHSYEFVKRDFENCDKYLEREGFILFDNSSDSSVWSGVRRVVREVVQTGRYDLIAKNPNYLFRKK